MTSRKKLLVPFSTTLLTFLSLIIFILALVHIPTSNSLLLTTTSQTNTCTSTTTTTCQSRHNSLWLSSMTNPESESTNPNPNPNPNQTQTDNNNHNNNMKQTKRLILIRHGRTYMNEYLSQAGCEWGDAHFTDIFPNPKGAKIHAEANQRPDLYYRDSPLSPDGVRQAHFLSSLLGQRRRQQQSSQSQSQSQTNENEDENDFSIEDIELVVVSPLTRALQTVDLGIMPHLTTTTTIPKQDTTDGDDTDGPMVQSVWGKTAVPVVPVLALPLATERNYLVSDRGTPTSLLSLRFPYINFQSEFQNGKDETNDGGGGEWWHGIQNNDDDDYIEWRPNQEGQTYAHPGEPDDIFHKRMVALYDWLDARTESCLCLVCHWGVLQWLTGESFENCEVRVVSFDRLRRTGFADG